MSGLEAGSRIQQEQARLAQESNLAQMKSALQEQQNQRENLLEQQKLAQLTAYNQQNIAIQKQQLDQAAQLNQIKTREASQLFQAQQGYQQWLAANPDKDPAEGLLRFFAGQPDVGLQGAGTLAHALWQERQQLGSPQVVTETDPETGERFPFLKIPERGGGYRMQAMRGAQDVLGREMLMGKIKEAERQRDKLEASLETDQRCGA
jgi:hypothetical protein